MGIGLSPDEIQWLAGEIQSVRHEIRATVQQLKDEPFSSDPSDYWLAQSEFCRFRKFYEFEDSSFLEKVRSGGKDAVDDAIIFLEANPYCFRSGYIKKKLCRALAHAPLASRQRLRLRDIVINAVITPRPIAFQGFIILGCSLYTSGFYARIRNLKIMPFKYIQARRQKLLAAMECRAVVWNKMIKSGEPEDQKT